MNNETNKHKSKPQNIDAVILDQLVEQLTSVAALDFLLKINI